MLSKLKKSVCLKIFTLTITATLYFVIYYIFVQVSNGKKTLICGLATTFYDVDKAVLVQWGDIEKHGEETSTFDFETNENN